MTPYPLNAKDKDSNESLKGTLQGVPFLPSFVPVNYFLRSLTYCAWGDSGL